MAKIADMTPDVMKTVVTPELLRESCQKYQKELLQMPFMVFQDQTAKYVTVLPGIRNQLTFGELDGDAELGPWSKTGNHKDADYEIKGRTLEVFPGNCSRDFDPMPLFHSIYGEALASGMNEISAGYIARKLVSLFAAKIGKHINDVIFVGGVRNKNGHTTADLFDSFDTIIAKEIESGEDLAVSKGNLINLGSIDKTNAVDVLKEYWRSADSNLRGQKTFMYMSPEIYWAYIDDYQARHGALPYNKEFEKTFLEGSQNKCEFAVLDNMAGSNFLKISTKPNFLLGTDIMGQENHVGIAKYKSWVITFEFASVYGLQIRTLSKEALHVGVLSPESANTDDDNDDEPETIVVKSDATVSFQNAVANATVGQEFSSPVATVNPAGKTLTYSSSDETVATVDSATGAVTLVGAGTTLITASFAGDENYNAAHASYALTVASE